MLPEKPKKIAILTGAGMSTESGIPDFRSETGLWKTLRPEEVASVEALEHHEEIFHSFYANRIEKLKTIQPHHGHAIIAELEQKGILHVLATQNVDRLHQKAGSKDVLELHGNIQTCRCQNCNKQEAIERFLIKQPCQHCKGSLRPNVVLFGEMLETDVWEQAIAKIAESDCFIVIGTSLQVSPVRQLPEFANGHTIYLNHERVDYPFDTWMEMSASEGLKTLAKQWI